MLFIISKTFADYQTSGSCLYDVLQRDNRAHVMKINNCPRQGETQYGYVFFNKSALTEGPVWSVTKVKLVMVWSSLDKNKNKVGFNVTSTEDEVPEYMEHILFLNENKDLKRFL